MKSVFLDNHTTTRPTATVVKGMEVYLRDKFALHTSPYTIGQELLKPMNEAYDQIYDLLSASLEDSCFFASSLKEAVHQILFATYFEITKNTGKNHFITSAIDEAPLLLFENRLQKLGCHLKIAEVDENGQMSKELFKEAISPRTALLSIAYANSLTGVIQPIEEIAKICKERGILLHIDASSVVGKIYLNIDEIKPDFLTINGESIHGPKGSAILYVRKGIPLDPSPVNVPALVGLGLACKETYERMDLMGTEIARLRERFEDALLKISGVKVLFKNSHRLPNTVCALFPKVFNELLLFHLNKKGIYATVGGGNFQKISLILMASGIPADLAHTAISFALSYETTEEDIDRTIEAIEDSYHSLQKLAEHL